MRPIRRQTSWRFAATVALAVLVAPLLGTSATAVPDAVPPADARTSSVPTALAAAVGDEVTFVGHGWGHGRGMGQYGALGFAVNYGWGYRDILARYYSNTSVGNVGNPQIDVELVVPSQRSWAILAGNGLLVNGADIGGAGLDVVLVERSGSTYTVKRGTSCESASWTTIGTYSGAVQLSVPTQSGFENLIRSCEAGNTMRAYRGSIVATAYGSDGTRMLVANRVTLEDYLLGVVGRESPDSWGSLGGGRGMQALMAQTVAARSYAMASSRSSGAKTCDTTSCQVYGGAAELAWNGSGYGLTKILDGANTNAAVGGTAGEVRMLNGAVARTEFSSSTGGYTAGGTFPAVPDEGDAVSLNPNRTWSTTMTPSDIATKLGVPGPVRDIQVTARNGLGDWGGRATQLRVVDANGAAHVWNGGETIRTKLGLKSDWFVVSWVSPAAAQAVVTALYSDLLGRGPDPTGLAGWSNLLMSGTSQSALVASLTSSDEYIDRRVRQAYNEVLGREPDPVGAAGWRDAIKAGRSTVDDVQRTFYDSAEYFEISGGTPEGYISRLYTTMLARAVSGAELAQWVALFGSSGGRAYVANNIWWSLEAAQKRAGAYYQTFLGRAPDPAGVEAWARVLLAQGEGAVRVGIAGSEEYRQRAISRFP